MKVEPLRAINLNKKTLYSLLGINLAAVIYYIFFVLNEGYLPSPFAYDKHDTFMDLFHPMFFALHQGAYDVYRSIYPPLNFVFLNFFSGIFNGFVCFDTYLTEFTNAFQLRDSSLNLIFAWIGIYLFMPILVIRTKAWNLFKLNQKIFLYIIFITSIPALFTLERGNLILLALFPLALALSSKSFLREVSLATLINLKPYFVLLSFFYLFKGEWRNFFRLTLIAAAIFLCSGFIFDSKNFLLMFANFFNYSTSNNYSGKEVIDMASSFSSLIYIIQAKKNSIFYNYRFDILLLTLKIIFYILIFFPIYILFCNRKFIKLNYLLLIGVCLIANLSVNFGGYTLILYFPLVPFLVKLKYSKFYLLFLLIIFLPYFYFPLYTQHLPDAMLSFVSGQMVYPEYHFTFGSVIRPIVNIIFLYVLCFESYIFKADSSILKRYKNTRSYF